MDLLATRQLRSLQETPNSVNGKLPQLESVSSVSSLSSERYATYNDISMSSRTNSEDSPEQKRFVNIQIIKFEKNVQRFGQKLYSRHIFFDVFRNESDEICRYTLCKVHPVHRRVFIIFEVFPISWNDFFLDQFSMIL